jgi:hypothetical protein
MEKAIDTNVFRSMQTENPYKSYIKTILGKLYLTVLSPFSNEPEGKILEGHPGRRDENCIYDVWSEREDVFLKRMNKRNFELGFIVEHKRSKEVQEVSPNELTDDEVVELLNGRFLVLQRKVEKMTSVAPVFRLITAAKELEKSEKYVNFLKEKLSELQKKEYTREEV